MSCSANEKKEWETLRREYIARRRADWQLNLATCERCLARPECTGEMRESFERLRANALEELALLDG